LNPVLTTSQVTKAKETNNS